MTAEVTRAGVAEGLIMTAVAEEAIARQNALTSASTALALETAARAADDAASSRITTEVARLDTSGAYLLSRSDSTNAALIAMNVDHLGRFTWLENSTNQQSAGEPTRRAGYFECLHRSPTGSKRAVGPLGEHVDPKSRVRQRPDDGRPPR